MSCSSSAAGSSVEERGGEAARALRGGEARAPLALAEVRAPLALRAAGRGLSVTQPDDGGGDVVLHVLRGTVRSCSKNCFVLTAGGLAVWAREGWAWALRGS